MKKYYPSIILLVCLAFTTYGQAPSNPAALQPGKNEIMIRMADGTALATDVYLPKKKGRHSAVLVRTPYNKSSDEWMGKDFGKPGIAVIVQDVRGKFKSEGEYYAFINERPDGLETLRWIRQQPWSDGIVAGWGGSYVGYTQWAISDSLNFLTPGIQDVFPDGKIINIQEGGAKVRFEGSVNLPVYETDN